MNSTGRTFTRTTRGVLGGALAAGLLLATACSSGSNPAPTVSGSTSNPASSGSTATLGPSGALPPGVTPQPSIPASVPNDVDKRKSVQITGCKSAPGGWQAIGSAKNSGSSDETYDITVFFTTTGSTVIATAQTSVTVGAGKSENWTASAEFTAADTMLCVLRGVA